MLVAGELAAATSGPDCYRRLMKNGFRLYRRGKSVGVEDLEECRKYRLKTLGLADTFERSRAAWQRLPERLRRTADTDKRLNQPPTLELDR